MSERDDEHHDEAQDPPRGGNGRRPPRSGEGMDSLLTHLREQESQRLQEEPTIGPSKGN